MTEPLRVLIVEDEALIVMQLETLLEDAGHVVVGTAYAAAEAIRLAEETRPDVAFVDLRLRGSSGLDVVRALDAIGGIALVFVTANARMLVDDFEGATAVIAKPFSEAVLEGCLPYLEECIRRPPPRTALPLGMRLAPAYETLWANPLPAPASEIAPQPSG